MSPQDAQREEIGLELQLDTVSNQNLQHGVLTVNILTQGHKVLFPRKLSKGIVCWVGFSFQCHMPPIAVELPLNIQLAPRVSQ